MPYRNETKHSILFVIFVLLLLVCDVGQFFLIGATIVPLLLCMYAALLSVATSNTILISIALLQCLEFFCFYNYFFLPFLFIIPMTIMGLYFKKHLYPSLTHSIAISCIGNIVRIYAIDRAFFAINLTSHYTIMQMSAIIMVTICFSLTLQSWGMQDNRL